MGPLQIVETNVSSRMAVLDLSSKLLQEGVIEINDVFTADTVSDWRNALLYLKTKFNPEDTKHKPIQIHINSPGGDVYSMFGLYDTIKSMQKAGYVISTVNVGLAASAACFILMSGSNGYRKSLSHCRTMIHTVSSGTFGKIAEMIVDVEEGKNIQKELDDIINNNASAELIKNCKYLDFWMSADDALKYNIIDEIVV